VEQLNTAYARCIDTDRLEEWPDFFAEECLYQIISAENHERGLPLGLIFADSKAMLRDRVTALRQANIYEAQRYRHLVSSLVILDASDLSAVRAESHFLVVRTMQAGDSSVFAVGCFADIIDLSSPNHHFKAKQAILDSDRIDTLLAIPL
jgi:3-phenylpropionate/cinnamic acid dioxygenase small subunit